MSKAVITQDFAENIDIIVDYATRAIGGDLTRNRASADYAEWILEIIIEIQDTLRQAKIIKRSKKK